MWKGEAHKYLVTPNNLSVAPYNIHRICSPLIAYLRKLYINCCLYVNDSILISPEYNKMVTDIKNTLEGFMSAGFTINQRKSVLVPVQQLTFLGFDIDTIRYTISVSSVKQVELKNLVEKLLKLKTAKIKIRLIAKHLGKIVATFPASYHA